MVSEPWRGFGEVVVTNCAKAHCAGYNSRNDNSVAKPTNAEVVWNPNDFNAPPPWPRLHDGGELRLACVVQLYPLRSGKTFCWKFCLVSAGLMSTGLVALGVSHG
jgi:hypothetical protein